jgi:NitT/TauT family transport system substrate-binding protein
MAITRHTFVAAGVASACSAIFARPVLAQTGRLDPLRIGVVPVEVCSEAFYGVDLDFFRAAGIDAHLEFVTSPGAIATALLGNSIDVGLFDTVGMITAHSRNVPLVLLAPGKLYQDADPTIGTVVLANAPIRAARDFAGTFAVSSVNNVAALVLQAWIDRNGGDSKRVKFVEMPFPAMNEALERHSIDGAISIEPWLSDAGDKGLRTIWPSNGIAPVFTASAWVSTRAWADGNKGLAERFTGAIYQAGKWGNRNRVASIPIVAKYTKLPVSVLAKMHRGAFAEASGTDGMQPLIDAMVSYGFIPKGFPAAELTYRP